MNRNSVYLSGPSSFALSGNWGGGGAGTTYHAGDFTGDGKTDILFAYKDGSGWHNAVAESTGSAFRWLGDWLPKVGNGTTYHIGDFTGDGKHDILFAYKDGSGWHNAVAESTGSAFSWLGDWLPAAGTATTYHVGNFDGANGSDLLLVRAIRSGFVYAEGERLRCDGTQYFVKGANYLGGRYIATYIRDGEDREHYNNWQIYKDLDEGQIESELALLKSKLGVNTIRIFTPSRRGWVPFEKYHGWGPWFEASGAITPTYRQRLLALLGAARRVGLKVQLNFFHNVQIHSCGRSGDLGCTEWRCQGTWCSKLSAASSLVAPGSDDEKFYLTYLRSLIPHLKDNATIMSYEVGNEMLVDKNYNIDGTNRWYDQNILSFIRRMMIEIRNLDPDHLITSGEVITGPTDNNGCSQWHCPSAEFAAVVDPDYLNGGTPYSLFSLVDYVGPHMYGRNHNDPHWVAPMIAALKTAAGAKPVVLGEFGYRYHDPSDNPPRLDAPPASDQKVFVGNVLGSSCKNHLSGYLAWDPLPIFAKPDSIDWFVPSWEPSHQFPILHLADRSSAGIIYYSLSWKLLDDLLRPLPAGVALKNASCSF